MEKVTSNDFKRAKKLFLLLQLLKFFNALIALDNDVVRDTKEIFIIIREKKYFCPLGNKMLV